MYLKKVTNTPKECTCEVEELKNNVQNSKISGWVLVKQCKICSDLSEKQRIENIARETERKLAQEQDERIRLKLREIALREL